MFVISLSGKEYIFKISNSLNVQSSDINKILFLSLTQIHLAVYMSCVLILFQLLCSTS